MTPAVAEETGIAKAVPVTAAPKTYWSLDRCKRSYLDYLSQKSNEIEEQKNSRRYYHSDQWTRKQIEVLNKRKQPVVTFNRIGRKIDGVVGLLERLRQDPKAYPRTPKHEEGAELATAALRYVLDEQEWKAKSPEVARDGAIDGIGGVEIEISPTGDQGDNEVTFDIVEPDSFFYDPRSFRADFTDARFMGVGKWLDQDVAIDLFPDKADEIESTANDATDLSSNPDRENKWFSETGAKKMVRVVDIWYQHKGSWCWAIFTGSTILMEGESYLKDEKEKTHSKYVMFSGNVDHDGDRYGFVRNMKSAQDEYNSRRSKALFTLQSRRLIASKGAVPDIEVARREWARNDGVVIVNGTVGESIKAEDQSFDFAGQLKLMENAISELENYGPNQALIGDMSNQSGRAIQLLQQAGMAELGPYLLAYKGWKVRLYRALWNAIRNSWTGERWIRVTDDENLAQMVQVNGQGMDPQTGMPALINSIASLDVDIILDESSDAINMQADAYDTLTVMASKGASVPPSVLIELAPLQGSVKKKLLDLMQQQDPMVQQGKSIALAAEAAKVKETDSKTLLNVAKANEAAAPEVTSQPQYQEFELPPEIQIAEAAAGIRDKNASAAHKSAQAQHIQTETALAPIRMAHEAHRAEFAPRK